MNWVHVRNLVQAHVLAAEALTAAKGYVAVSLCSPHLTVPTGCSQGIPSPGDSWLTHFSSTQDGWWDCPPREAGGRGVFIEHHYLLKVTL